MNFRYIAAAAVLVAVCTAVPAQDTIHKLTRKEAELLVPRIGTQPVKSMTGEKGNAIDTMETQSPGVMIIMFDDYTWKYYRDPEAAMAGEVFKEYWTHDYPDPYHIELKDLPDRISLWVVDTLSEYKCPYQTKVYSPFGYRRGRRHQGVDLPLKTGDEVYAAFSGKVRMSKYYAGYGNLVIIRHENGLETFYGHLSRRLVEVDQWVEAGQIIGLGGSTGRSTGPHLHFETRYRGYAFDPQWLIDFESGTLRHRLFVLRKKYLNAGSRYVPESDEEEEEILKDVAEEKAAAEKAAAEKAAARYYKIKSGDTLSRIAVRNGTTVSAICKLNPGLTPKTVLKIGRTIRIK